MQRNQHFDLFPGTQHLNISRNGLAADVRGEDNATDIALAPIDEGSGETPETTSGTPATTAATPSASQPSEQRGQRGPNCGGWRAVYALLMLLGVCLLGAGIGIFVALTRRDDGGNTNPSSASGGTATTPTVPPLTTSPSPPAPTPTPTPPAQPPLSECLSGETAVDVSITTDSFPRDTTWELLHENETIAQGGPYDFQFFTIVERVCIPPGTWRRIECIIFTIFDTNGICCAHGDGGYSVSVNGEELLSGGQFTTSETNEKCFEVVGPPPTPRPSMQSPTPAPTLFSLTFSGTAVPSSVGETATPSGGQFPSVSSPPSSPAPSPPPQPSPPPTQPSQPTTPSKACLTGETTFDVSITTDSFPLDTTWQIAQNNTILAKGGPYMDPNSQIVERACILPSALSNGPCVTFAIFDDNGICCKFGPGQYSVSVDGEELKTGGQFFMFENFEHCL